MFIALVLQWQCQLQHKCKTQLKDIRPDRVAHGLLGSFNTNPFNASFWCLIISLSLINHWNQCSMLSSHFLILAHLEIYILGDLYRIVPLLNRWKSVKMQFLYILHVCIHVWIQITRLYSYSLSRDQCIFSRKYNLRIKSDENRKSQILRILQKCTKKCRKNKTWLYFN